MAQLNVDKLAAGHELDALTAERVFGWKDIERREHQPWGKRKDKGGRWRSARVPDYSTDPTYADDLEQRMNELGLLKQYLKELAKASRAKGLPSDWAPPDQRCRAAIKAIKSKKKSRASYLQQRRRGLGSYFVSDANPEPTHLVKLV